MNYFLPLSQPDIDAYNKNWGWFFVWGIALIILGLTAIYFSMVATVVSVIFLGTLLIFAGVFVVFDTFQFWWGKWGGFTAHLIIGLLYAVVGIMLIQQPVASSISITLLLGIFYIFLGIFRLIYPLTLELPQKGWRLFNGLITLLLGILILAEWPMSGLFIIGLFIGIDLLIAGWIYTAAALAAKTLLKSK
jgi:uncharacterized membrane protein HdeD (DUF308 family)